MTPVTRMTTVASVDRTTTTDTSVLVRTAGGDSVEGDESTDIIGPTIKQNINCKSFNMANGTFRCVCKNIRNLLPSDLHFFHE